MVHKVKNTVTFTCYDYSPEWIKMILEDLKAKDVKVTRKELR